VPVASGPTGYYLAVTETDRKREVESIRDKIGQLNARKIAFERAGEGYTVASNADDGDTCEHCGDPVAGDPYLWFSAELCADCHDVAPATVGAFKDWMREGVKA